MVEDDVEVLSLGNSLLEGLHLNADLLGQSCPGSFDIINLIDVELARVGAELLPNVTLDLDAEFACQIVQGIVEGVDVRSGSTVVEPGDSLKADTGIDDLDLELLSGAVVKGLVLHEHHVADLEASHEVLNRGAEVAAASPDVLDEGDLIGVDLELLSEPPVVELNALVLEEDVLLGVIEDLNAKHDEAGVVATSQADVVEIIKADAELRADQRVGGRVELASHAVWLEAVDAGSHVVDVVSPAGDHRVALDGFAGYAG